MKTSMMYSAVYSCYYVVYYTLKMPAAEHPLVLDPFLLANSIYYYQLAKVVNLKSMSSTCRYQITFLAYDGDLYFGKCLA